MNKSFKKLIEDKVPVLVDFSAEWCGPCKMMQPVLQQLKRSMEDKIRIIKIDVDRNSELADKFNIRSVPSLILFHEGKVRWNGVGVMTADHLKNVIYNNCNFPARQETL